jgi:hypothetical protein
MPIPGVGDGKLDEATAIAHLAYRKFDLARFGELACITEEIEKDLPQPQGVQGQCAEVLFGVNDEAVLVLLGKLSGRADDIFDQRRPPLPVAPPHSATASQRVVGDSKNTIILARSSADVSPPYGFMLLPGTISSGFAMNRSSFSLSHTKSVPFMALE